MKKVSKKHEKITLGQNTPKDFAPKGKAWQKQQYSNDAGNLSKSLANGHPRRHGKGMYHADTPGTLQEKYAITYVYSQHADLQYTKGRGRQKEAATCPN